MEEKSDASSDMICPRCGDYPLFKKVQGVKELNMYVGCRCSGVRTIVYPGDILSDSLYEEYKSDLYEKWYKQPNF